MSYDETREAVATALREVLGELSEGRYDLGSVSRRERIATVALSGILASPEWAKPSLVVSGTQLPAAAARIAVVAADALIAELDKPR